MEQTPTENEEMISHLFDADDFTRLLWYVDEINMIDAATTDSGITNSVHCIDSNYRHDFHY